jgi:phosphatidylinositol alpha-1,6-mannosyltransferase
MIVITTQNFPPDRGGIEMLMGGLADALAQAGETTAVFADRIRTSGLGERGGLAYPVRRFGGLRPLRRRIKALAVARAARAPGVKGIFADSYKSIEFLPALDAPIAVLAHGMEFPAHPSPAKRRRITRALAKARTVIANSAYTASLVRPYLEDGDERLRVINPPIGAQPEASAQAKDQVNRLIKGRSPVVLSLARLEPRKGIDMVVHALPAALKRHPNALLIIAGDGADRARLEEIAAETGATSHVHFTGAVDADMKAALFAAADLFAMPTRREGDSIEGFGIVFVEAGWYGVPAVAGREGGAVDAVADGQTGLLCNGSALNDVSDKMARLLNDPALRKRLGAAAAERARASLWNAMLPRFLEALS